MGNGRGEYPLGVRSHKNNKKNPFQSRCNSSSKSIHLGYFQTPEQAHQAWLINKLETCEGYLLEFKDDSLITKGLTRIKNKLEYHIETKTELTSF